MIHRFFFILTFISFSHLLFGQQYSSRTGHLYVQSANRFVNIEADNYQINSTINAATGKIVLLGLLKSFEFRIGGLDQAFNSNAVKTISHPKFNYKGEITNISTVRFNSPGTYPVKFQGVLELWNMKRTTPGTGTITVHENGTISIASDISFQIEEASVQKANQLIKSYMPSGVNIDTDKLGISRTIRVEANGTYRKRRSSTASAN